jgi:DNA polymerase-3 subunit delta'
VKSVPLDGSDLGNIINGALYGNDALKAIVSEDIASGRFVHALIIEGPPKSGKLTLARAVAATLSGTQSAADKILRGISADVYEIAPRDGRKTLGVDSIREIRETAFIIPNDSDIKAYIVRYADTMTVQAQNAMLKLLEEPPKNVYFMLLVENASALLATVRSRAPVVRMQVFTSDELREYLVGKSVRAAEMARNAPDELFRMIARSGGSIGEALRMIGDGDRSATIAQQVVSLLEILCAGNRPELYIFPFPTKTREEAVEFFSLLRVALRDMCALRSKGKCQTLFGDDGRLSELSKKVGIETLLRCELTASEIVSMLRMNLALGNVKAHACTALAGAFSQ